MPNMARPSLMLTAAVLTTLGCSPSRALSSTTPHTHTQRVRRQVAITPPASDSNIVYTWHDESTSFKVHTVYLAAEATHVHTHYTATPTAVEHLDSFLAVPIQTLKHTLVAHEMRQLESPDQYRKWFYTQVAQAHACAPHCHRPCLLSAIWQPLH
jgi:hypothetical protein